MKLSDKQLLAVQVLWRVAAAFLFLLPVLAPAYAIYTSQWWWLALAPVTPLLFLALAEKTHQKTSHIGQPDVQRYRLPSWLAWAETPDEHLPGGLYEPTHMKVYKAFGWVGASMYWLLTRNVGQGLLWPRGIFVGQIYVSKTPNGDGHWNYPLLNIDFNNEDELKAVREQVLIDRGLTPTESRFLFFKWVFYYELVKDFYGTKSPVRMYNPDWRTVGYVAVLRLGVKL